MVLGTIFDIFEGFSWKVGILRFFLEGSDDLKKVVCVRNLVKFMYIIGVR